MYIAFSANRRGVAEALSNGFDSASHVTLGGGFAVEGFELRKRYGRQHRARPRAKILRRDIIVTTQLAKIAVDVIGRHRPDFSVFGFVLEEVLAGQLLTAAYDARDATVRDREVPDLSRLATKPESSLRL